MRKIKFFVLLILVTGFWISSCNKEDTAKPGALVPLTVDENPSLPSISVNNTKLHAETFGNADDAMIIILHGGPGADYRGLLQCKDLAQDGYFVVFYDQRGSGLSKRHHKDEYTIQLMLDDLTAVINHYRTSPTQKVFLFGHSWGAMLATAYINSYPTTINGVVLAEPGGFTYEDTKTYISKSKPIKPFNENTNDVFYTDQFITGKENEHAILDYKFALSSAYSMSVDNITGNAGKYPFWRYGAVVQSAMFTIAQNDGFDWTTDLNLFPTKVLFLYSELNQAYGFDYAQKVSSAYPNVEMKEIIGSGHEMLYFGWEQVHSVALEYFNSLK